MSRLPLLVQSAAEAVDNILTFAEEASAYPELSLRVGTVHEWYAARDSAGRWRFGPSKWVGYKHARATEYLSSSGKGGVRAGGKTEEVLPQWFEAVDPSSMLGKQLHAELTELLGRWGKRPRRPVGISILKSEMDAYRQARQPAPSSEEEMSRIACEPDVCGGRPVIRGTRVRVADLIDMMASGAGRDEILSDYPYLTDADLSAALAYAARATSHLVIRAA